MNWYKNMIYYSKYTLWLQINEFLVNFKIDRMIDCDVYIDSDQNILQYISASCLTTQIEG